MRFVLFTEPDLSVHRETAIATTSITGADRRLFSKFKLLKEETKMSDHKCTDQIIEEFNTGVYEDRAKRGFHPYSYETHLKLKAIKKFYWATARALAEHFRWAGKQVQNRVRRQKNGFYDDGGRWVSRTPPVNVRPWNEPPVCWVFVTKKTRHWDATKTIPFHMSDYGMLHAYEKSRMPRAKEDVLLLKPILPEVEAIDTLFDQITKWQAEGILELIQKAA